MELFYAISVFVIGLCAGSFLNVCIHRIPDGISVISPASSCPACGHRIKWFENIPLFSYALLKGRCSECNASISIRYPLVELLTGILLTLLFLRFGLSINLAVYGIFTCALIVITFIDIKLQIIPDVISLSGIIIGFMFSLLPGGIGWFDSFIGIIAGGGILYLVAWGYFLLARREGMGGGDIKLLGMIGAFLGWQSIPFVIFFSAATGSIIGISVMIAKGRDMKFAIPFGPFLATAAFVYLVYGQEMVAWYLSLAMTR